MEKTVVGSVEKVKINGHEILARMDTGAERNSISVELVEEFKLKPSEKIVKIKTSTGKEERPVMKGELEIAGKKIETYFNVTDRSHMQYAVLIGREVLKQDFSYLNN